MFQISRNDRVFALNADQIRALGSEVVYAPFSAAQVAELEAANPAIAGARGIRGFDAEALKARLG